MADHFDADQARLLLADEDTHPVILIAILLEKYKDDLFRDEDTVALFKDAEEDFTCRIPEENETKINAALTCMRTDLFFTNENVFKATVLSFTEGDLGDLPHGGDEELDASAALWTMIEVGLLNDMNLEEVYEECSPSIRKYLDELVEAEAEDEEEVGEGVDTFGEALHEPYFQRYVQEQYKELTVQLIHLGAPADLIQSFIVENRVDLEDVEV